MKQKNRTGYKGAGDVIFHKSNTIGAMDWKHGIFEAPALLSFDI
jgi:hypothetical protein